MKNEITLVKVIREDIPFKTCLIPLENIDIEIYKLITVGGIIHCSIKSDRTYPVHKWLWKMILHAISCGINEKDCKVYGTDFILKKEVIHARYIESGCDWIETWREILQTLYLPKLVITDLNGEKKEVTGSISYKKLDEIEMKRFENNVSLFFSDNLEMGQDDFIRECK
jgi:hypothetical protein